VALVDSAEAIAAEVAELVPAGGASAPAAHRFFATDTPGRFHEIAERFLGRPLPGVEQVDI